MDERLRNSRFLRACRGEEVDATPIWLMRQAGRYMAEYREVRAKHTFLEMCLLPEIACEVTVTAQQRIGADAAILWADLLPILIPMGFDLDYLKGEGPKISNPLRSAADLARVKEHDPSQTQPFVAEAVRLLRRELKPDIPLIGFAGAPFTLASYAIEGGSSRHFENCKALMFRDEGAWNELLGRIARVVTAYLNMQIDAGVQAVQLFDSWVGCLSASDYRRYALPHTAQIIASIKGRVPVIHFGVDTGHMMPEIHSAGGDVVGMDWRTPLRQTWDALGCKAVQGNLDPILLLAGREALLGRAKQLLDEVGNKPGHIFNLGHGVLPSVDVEDVVALVDFVHEYSAR